MMSSINTYAIPMINSGHHITMAIALHTHASLLCVRVVVLVQVHTILFMDDEKSRERGILVHMAVFCTHARTHSYIHRQ